MKTLIVSAALSAVLTAVVTLPGAAHAAPVDDMLTAYAQAAKTANPGFTGFTAERGALLYAGPHAGGKPDTPACAACHTADPRAVGRNVKTGRDIAPMAPSVNPKRLTDPAQVEKRFVRDCDNVLGRECTQVEKGDFLTFLLSR